METATINMKILHLLACELEVGDILIPLFSNKSFTVTIEKIGRSFDDGAILIYAKTNDGNDYSLGLFGQSEVMIVA
jgi:hypothetical protein